MLCFSIVRFHWLLDVFFCCAISLALGVVFFYCTMSLALGVVFFYCAISLALGVVFFYCTISLALVQLGITCNTEVTQNGPRANRLSLSNSTFLSLQLECKQEPSYHKLVCDYRYALKVNMLTPTESSRVYACRPIFCFSLCSVLYVSVVK